MGVYKGAFNMSQEYYSVEKESNLGALNIGFARNSRGTSLGFICMERNISAGLRINDMMVIWQVEDSRTDMTGSSPPAGI